MKNKNVWIAIVAFITMLVFSRLTPFIFDMPWNIGILGAVAIFGGAYLSKSWKTIVFILMAIWFSDIVVNYKYFGTFTPFYNGYFFTFISYVATIFVGKYFLENKKSFSNIFGAGLLSAVVFYLISNFGAWLTMPQFYTRDLSGLLASYEAGLPFFRGTIIGNVVFTFLLVSVYEYTFGRNKSSVKYA